MVIGEVYFSNKTKRISFLFQKRWLFNHIKSLFACNTCHRVSLFIRSVHLSLVKLLAHNGRQISPGNCERLG